MRLKIEFISEDSFDRRDFNNYFINSLIWNLLRDTEFAALHDSKTFKFFNFSEILPIKDFIAGEAYKFFMSSPNNLLIDELGRKLEKLNSFRLGVHRFKIKEIKKFELPIGNKWVTSTPIVLYKDNRKNEYFSFERDLDFEFFLNRLKENSLKKWNQYFNKDAKVPFHLFENLIFKRTVVKKFRKQKKEFIIIGTMCELILPKIHSKKVVEFYKFIRDTGLGEKNSFGFGFINPIS